MRNEIPIIRKIPDVMNVSWLILTAKLPKSGDIQTRKVVFSIWDCFSGIDRMKYRNAR